jgi:hypothetical protein
MTLPIRYSNLTLTNTMSLRCVLPVFPPCCAFPLYAPCNILTQFTSSTSCFQFQRFGWRRFVWCEIGVIPLRSVFLRSTVVSAISEVFNLYEERMRSMQKVPLFSHGRKLLRSHAAPNNGLFNDHATAIQFLKDIGFIRRTMQCKSCKRDMTASSHVPL